MADNIRAKAQGSDLFLKIDLNENFGPTKSGKTEIVAQGFWLKLDEVLDREDLEGYKLNIMLVKPVSTKKPKQQVESFDDDAGFDEPAKKPARKAPAKKAGTKKPAAKAEPEEAPAKKPTRRRTTKA